MVFFITGATSFIGKALCRHLVEAGDRVVAVTRHACPELEELVPTGRLELLHTDLQQLAATALPLHADVLIHLAWMGVRREDRCDAEMQGSNIPLSLEMIALAGRIGCRLYVDAGSQEEYGIVRGPVSEETPCHPATEYGKAKLQLYEASREACDKLGIKYLHPRIFSVYGEDDHPNTLVMTAARKMRRNEPLSLSSCTQKWNYLCVRDAAAILGALCRKAVDDASFHSEVFLVASRDTRPLKDFVESMKAVLHSDSRLDYGLANPDKDVWLEPDLSKLTAAVGQLESHRFEEVVARLGTDPVLSISIPIYNRSQCLVRMLDRFLEDSDLFEEKIYLYVSDNCSTEDLKSIVDGYVARGLRVHYHRNEENIGADLNICACFRAGQGKYTLVLGSDDIPQSGFLRGLLPILEDGEYGMVHINIYDGRKNWMTQEYRDAEKFFVDMHGWITFISIHIVATRFIPQVPVESYASKNLAQIPLYLKAGVESERNLVVNHVFLTPSENGNPADTAGYNAFQVFIVYLLDLLDEAVAKGQLSRKAYKAIKRRTYKYIITQHIVNLLILKRTNYNHNSRTGWKIVWEYYGKHLYAYYYLAWRIVYAACHLVFVKKLGWGKKQRPS